MSDPRTLARLEQLRRRARDDARHRLAEARAALAALERRRRGWRDRLDTEAGAAEDAAALPRWLEACRTRERALARQAERLAAAVAAAERAYRTARLQLEQIEALRARTRETARREALRRDQRRLDELKPMSGR